MNKLYKKSEITFAIVMIIAYIVVSVLSDNFSDSIGIYKLISAPVLIIFSAVILAFIRKNGLAQYYGLCKFQRDIKGFLYFLPLVVIASVNLWFGAEIRVTVLEIVLHIVSMLCVGFIEELLFRGFLFRAMCKENIKSAVIVSSVTFGIGHIVNLLNGTQVLPTLLQLCYATAIGFLFIIIILRGKSIVPCIITHGVFNALSVFGKEPSNTAGIIASIVLCMITLVYALIIMKKTTKGNIM